MLFSKPRPKGNLKMRSLTPWETMTSAYFLLLVVLLALVAPAS